jgi:hypothetical protein
MSISPYRIVLSGGFGSVTIASDRQAAEASSGLRVDWDSGGVAGWDSAPDAKVSSTERQAGDGAHDVSESDIEYESRVVTVNIAAFGETRDEVLAAMRRLQAAHKQLVTMRVVDASSDTYCERGYVVVKWDEEWHEQTATGTLTAVFVRPHRLSTLPSEGVMVPATGGGGGLVFDDTSNLTPFFSHSLTDSSYWMYIDTEHITQLTDGWAHIAYDNSAGTSNKYIQAFVAPQSFVVGGKVYTTMVEIRNTTGATATGLYALTRDGNVTQLVRGTLPGIIPVKDGAYYFHQQTPNTNLIKGSNISVSADSTLNGGDKSSPVYDIDFDVINAHLGEKVTLSADFKLVNAVASATSQARCGLEPASPGYTWTISCWKNISIDSQNPTNFDGRISFTRTLPTTAFTQNIQPYLYIQGLTAGTCVVSNPKLELGSVATAYSPAAGELSTFTGGLNRSFASIAPGENVSFDMRLSLYEGTYVGDYKPYYERVNVLHWPLSFGAGAIRTGNSCTLTNSGTIPADITITASGYMPGGIAVTDTSTGRQLAYGQTVTWSGLTLDSRTRTASVAGVDVSRSLTSRDFPTVPAGGSVTLSLQASGTGTLTATCHDTYI